MDKNKLVEVLNYAIRIIKNYELDIRNSEEVIGIDLVKKGFCQGIIYKDALKVIEQKKEEKMNIKREIIQRIASAIADSLILGTQGEIGIYNEIEEILIKEGVKII